MVDPHEPEDVKKEKIHAMKGYLSQQVKEKK